MAEPDAASLITRRFVHRHPTRMLRSYAPSFFPDAQGHVSERHAQVEELVADMRGKLEPADHYKLYEAGYFARGPVLEIGRLHGRSTTLLALGLHDAGTGHPMTSIEWEAKYLAPAQANLDRYGLLDVVDLQVGDSSTVVRSLPGTFDTVFVDGDHSYEGVRKDLEALEGRIAPGGVVMFHDYFHNANLSGEYGVARAVDEAVPALGLEFRGRFGGISLHERVA